MINLGVLTVAAITNGLNPCGIGLMITFLGYLLVFSEGDKKRRWILTLGGVYILSVFVTYLLTGILFYGMAYYLQRWWLASVFKYIIGALVLGAGLIQIKDAFWQDLPLHLRMPLKGFEKLNALMLKASLPMAAVVGFLTTVFATPCMLPLYVGTATVLARSGLPMVSILGYFVYYNLVFILPLILILIVMSGGREIVAMKEWEHKNTKWMRLVLGLAMVIVAYLIVK